MRICPWLLMQRGAADQPVGDDDMSDDDDQSWKVRRSAAKVLCAMVETRRERLLTDVYGSIAPALVRRFGEREENVRLDVYATFAAVLHQIGQRQVRRIEDPRFAPEIL